MHRRASLRRCSMRGRDGMGLGREPAGRVHFDDSICSSTVVRSMRVRTRPRVRAHRMRRVPFRRERIEGAKIGYKPARLESRTRKKRGRDARAPSRPQAWLAGWRGAGKGPRWRPWEDGATRCPKPRDGVSKRPAEEGRNKNKKKGEKERGNEEKVGESGRTGFQGLRRTDRAAVHFCRRDVRSLQRGRVTVRLDRVRLHVARSMVRSNAVRSNARFPRMRAMCVPHRPPPPSSPCSLHACLCLGVALESKPSLFLLLLLVVVVVVVFGAVRFVLLVVVIVVVLLLLLLVGLCVVSSEKGV